MRAPPGDPTPAVFRYRVVLIVGIFLLALFAGHLLSPVPFFDALYGVLSLPSRLAVGAPAPPPASDLPLAAMPALLVLVGFWLRAWGTSYLRGSVMVDSRIHAERLIVAGPFRYVRNPLYLGNLFLAAGTGLYFPPPGLVVCLGGMAAIGYALARSEERLLRERHGAAYDAYAARVRRFLPGRPLPGNAPALRPDWLSGVAAEVWMPFHAVGLVATAMQVPGAWAFFVAGLSLFVVLHRAMARRDEASLREGARPGGPRAEER